MLKKTVTYTDFNDEEVTETLYFHLSEAEIVKLEVSHEGGLSGTIERLMKMDQPDGKLIIQEFENILLSSYGKRSPDGKTFIKNQQVRDEFQSSEAYSAVFMELLLDSSAQIEFINGIIPKQLQGRLEELQKQGKLKFPLEPSKDDDKGKDDSSETVREVTQSEVLSMSADELQKLNKEIEAGKATVVDVPFKTP